MVGGNEGVHLATDYLDQRLSKVRRCVVEDDIQLSVRHTISHEMVVGRVAKV